MKGAQAFVYRDTAHVIPTSILVERLFSKAKHILTYDRKRMEPRRLEEVLYLQYNRSLWDERTVQDALTRVEREAAAATSAASATSATSATTTTSASVAPIHEIDHDDDL